ncbi:hypothetical protein EJ08DRAFT_653036, partial [Tothia fuscella]
MKQRNNVEGRVYRFRSKTEREELLVELPMEVTEIVRAHMILVLDWVPGRNDYVKVMTITSKNHDGEYLPISPTPKKPYPFQLNFANPLPEFLWTGKLMRFTWLPLLSYLKVDASYDVPISALEEVADEYGNQIMLRLRQGGIRQLQHYVKSL